MNHFTLIIENHSVPILYFYPLDLVAECQKLISDCIHQPEYENAQGIMLIVGMLGVAGTANDVENVQKTFKELGFAVLTTPSPKSEKIACLIKAVAKPLAKYPLRYKYFAFYYSGHGGEDESGMFIRTLDVANSNPVLHIEKFIIKPLKELQLTRLFFFDCCQSPGSGEVFQSRGDIQKRPRPIAREVIAFATSGGQKALGGTKRGGVWTYHLCENLKKQDQPLVMVLAKTNGEVVKEREDMQKPYCENDIDEKLIISYGMLQYNDLKEIISIWNRNSRIFAVYIWTNDYIFTIYIISMS